MHTLPGSCERAPCWRYRTVVTTTIYLPLLWHRLAATPSGIMSGFEPLIPLAWGALRLTASLVTAGFKKLVCVEDESEALLEWSGFVVEKARDKSRQTQQKGWGAASRTRDRHGEEVRAPPVSTLPGSEVSIPSLRWPFSVRCTYALSRICVVDTHDEPCNHYCPRLHRTYLPPTGRTTIIPRGPRISHPTSCHMDSSRQAAHLCY